jgi:succinate dehydrogenase/fumarate reductase cytochrome b subunit
MSYLQVISGIFVLFLLVTVLLPALAANAQQHSKSQKDYFHR